MNENDLIGEMFRNIEVSYAYAYQELLKSKQSDNILDSPRLLYHLVCLSAGDDPEVAMSWLSYAIKECGYWYHHRFFEDKNLLPLSDSIVYQRLKAISKTRYDYQKEQGSPLTTWESYRAPHLVIVVHGEGGGIQESQKAWSHLESTSVQVEYIQSSLTKALNGIHIIQIIMIS